MDKVKSGTTMESRINVKLNQELLRDIVLSLHEVMISDV